MAALRSLLLACLAALLCGGQGGSHALPPEALGSASLACVRRGPAGGPALRARPAAHCGARGLLRLRGGSGSHEYTDHSLQQHMRRLQAAKDKMLAALERGDQNGARAYARELEALKAKAERRLARLQLQESAAAGSVGAGCAGVADAGAVTAGDQDDGAGSPVHYPSFLRMLEEEIAQRRAQLEAQTRRQVAEARARAPEAAVQRDEHGRMYADEVEHGVGKCNDAACEFCREELLEAPLDLGLRADGVGVGAGVGG
jgi:hypothetical protein